MQRIFLFGSALLLSFSATEAMALPPSADLRGTFAPLHTEGGLVVEPVDSPETGDVTGHARLNYGYRPVVLLSDDAVNYELISHQFTADVGLNVGLFGRLTLGMDLPILVGQFGDDFSREQEVVALVGIDKVPLASLGDPGLRAKVTIVKPQAVGKSSFRGFGLAADARITLPLGDEGSFIAEGEVTGQGRLLAEYGFGPASAHLSAGAKLRAEEASFACNAPLSSCSSRFGHELPIYAGVSLNPSELGIDPDEHWGLMVEAFGHLPLTPVAPTDSTLPWSLSAGATARYRSGDIAFVLGAYAALLDGIGSAPFSATLGVAFAPREADSDGDGLSDAQDECVSWPEDKDGFEDGDGCPEMDNDGDGVPDAMDDCPAAAGKPGDRGCAAPSVPAAE